MVGEQVDLFVDVGIIPTDPLGPSVLGESDECRLNEPGCDAGCLDPIALGECLVGTLFEKRENLVRVYPRTWTNLLIDQCFEPVRAKRHAVLITRKWIECILAWSECGGIVRCFRG